MQSNELFRTIGRCAAAAGVALLVAGCATRERTTTTQTTDDGARTQPASQREGMNMVSLAYPTGEERTSALLLRQYSPREVRLGQEAQYEIQVTNITNGTLDSVAVSTESMENLSITGSNPRMREGAGGSMQWFIGDLAAGQTETIRFTAVAEDTGTAGNCLSVSYSNVLCSQVNVVEPALRLVKSAPDASLLCDSFELRYEVTNSGTGVAENVRVRDELPEGLTTLDGRQTIDLDAGSLAAGQSRTLAVPVKASRRGTFSSRAAAAARGDLTARSSETSTAVSQPVLTIQASCEEQEYVGRNAEFDFEVSNTGDAQSNNTVVTSTIPSGVRVVRASEGATVSGNQVTWNVGSMAPDASRTFSVVVAGSQIGAIRLGASASGYCAETVTDACETDIVGIAAILLEVIDIEDPVEVGQNTTYVVRVTNQGSAIDRNIRIECELPAEASYISSAGATNGQAQGRTIAFAPLAALAPKATAEWRVTVRAEEAGDVRFTTRLTSERLTAPAVQETEATNFYR